jgi:hypothetical protein
MSAADAANGGKTNSENKKKADLEIRFMGALHAARDRPWMAGPVLAPWMVRRLLIDSAGRRGCYQDQEKILNRP